MFCASGAITSSPSRVLPRGLVERLSAEFAPSAATLAVRQVAADGTTMLLLRLGDGRTVESMLMPDFQADRAAGCLLSQVGCVSLISHRTKGLR